MKNVSIAFLERLKADFTKRYGGGKADTATAKSLNKEFGYAYRIVLLCSRLPADAFFTFFLNLIQVLYELNLYAAAQSLRGTCNI